MAAAFDLAESPVGAYFAQMAELGVMRLLTEYGVLAAIPDAGAGDGKGIAVEALAASLAPRVEYALLERFLRLLVASGTLVAPGPGRVARTPKAAAMADPAAAGFYNYLYDFFLGPAARWPAYFAAQGASDDSNGGSGGRLAEPATSRRCPAGFALGHPDKTAYEILAALPAQAQTLNGAMAVEGDIPITGFYDFGWLATAHAEHGAADGARPLLVDVGGGKGQALAAILGAHAGIPAARCVLQDQAAVVAVAQAEHEAAADPEHPLRAVRKAGASFFEASPAPGARAYYIRRVLNDWADAEAAAILGRLRAACAPDSRVLVAEYLRPEPADPAGAVVPAAVDMFIMSIGGKVRSEAMFRALAARAGFDVVRVAREPRTGSAVLELVPV